MENNTPWPSRHLDGPSFVDPSRPVPPDRGFGHPASEGPSKIGEIRQEFEGVVPDVLPAPSFADKRPQEGKQPQEPEPAKMAPTGIQIL